MKNQTHRLVCFILSLIAAPVLGQDSDIVRHRQELDGTVWFEERRAQEHGAFFVELWDRLRATEDSRAVLAEVAFDHLLLGSPEQSTLRDWDIVVNRYGSTPGRSLDRGQWQELLRQWEEAGLVLEQSEWHHERFIPATDGPTRSLIDMELHVRNREGDRRVIVSGELSVTWSADKSADGKYTPTIIDASHLTLTQRHAQPAFSEIAVLEAGKILSPLVAADMDADGLEDLLALGSNRLYRNRDGVFEPEPLLQYPPRGGRVEVALLADFTGDDEEDLVVAGPEQFVGFFDGQGGFSVPGMAISTRTLRNPRVMSAGDIDLDGDLDLWIGQYRPPFNQGQMPTPYYDANDGYIAYLLRNDGEGTFVDITVQAGLEAKRQRRTYSGSLADLDDDGDQDLLVVSDFAGVDLYHNDGSGAFSDVTSQVVSEAHSFGMSHAFGDYDGDGRLDLYIVGMSSHAARRLDYLGLGRDEFPEHDRYRAAMSYGNRIYLGGERGLFRIPAYTDQVARTGWSWGVASTDLDNDGDDEIFVANGHQSGTTAKDYCTTFWTHDVYTGSSEHDPQLAAFYDKTIAGWNRSGISWNGFEHNRLYLNDAGATRADRSFIEIGYLMGVASEFDSRSVLDLDFDADGRVDLLFTEWSGKPPKERIHLLRNDWPGDNNWIGVRLSGRGGVHPIGSRITLQTSQGDRTQWVYIGESLDAQRSTTRHFGLGQLDRIEAIEVQWPDGHHTSIDDPEINRYHEITPSEGDGGV